MEGCCDDGSAGSADQLPSPPADSSGGSPKPPPHHFSSPPPPPSSHQQQQQQLAMGLQLMRPSNGGGGGYLVHQQRPMLSPPGLTTDANDCRLIEYRGAKVAAFLVSGDFLLCLPQAFELFLKHLVGGLHTVYTKLKRLDITPIVCNVEQVRILRGLGAIQPGVNRCKLLSCKDFDTLYKDCTTARPGRPPKRATLVGLTPNGGGGGGGMLLKKPRMDDYYENGHMPGDRVDKNHLLANGYSHHPHLNPLPFMALNAAHHGSMLPLAATSHPPPLNPVVSSAPPHPLSAPPPPRPPPESSSSSSVIKERADVINSTRLRDDRSDLVDSKDRLYGFDSHRMKDQAFLNGYLWLLAGAQQATSNGHSPVLNLSQHSSRPSSNALLPTTGANGANAASDAEDDRYGDDDSEDDDEDDRDQADLSDNPDVSSTANTDRQGALLYPGGVGEGPGGPGSSAASSMETLLRNIQGLLKVAADNARQQERQISLEKAELKMELLREREVREGIEKQLLDEQRTRILYQKRLKKEKRTRRRVQEQLEAEVKKRAQYEEALRSNSAETLRLLNESLAQELERERNARAEAEHKMQDCPMSV